MNAVSTIPSAVEISDAEFDAITAIAVREAGLAIPKSKKSLVQSRIARRFRSLKISNCQDYLALLADSPDETRELISVLTTNVSSFFREAHHFEFLRQTIIPRLRETLAKGQPARIWSAGCSSGQEPYSIAIEIAKAFPDAAQQDLLILASDIDPKILDKARSGIYQPQDLEAVSPDDRHRFFTATEDGSEGARVSDELKRLIRFRELNLHGEWPIKARFDVIFCRNVVIYFDDDHQKQLWPRFRERLTDSGWLILGHSERIQETEASGFTSAGVTVYQRKSEN